jgi:DNA-binding NarL/FixJ family response regulator
MPTRRPRVLLADDNAGILVAFARLLKSSCDVVGQVSDGGALIEAISALQPDVVVVDLFMPKIDGLETYSRISQLAPQTKIVLVTAADDDSIRERALSAGAAAFVSKPRVVDELLPAIQSVMAKSTVKESEGV